MSTRARILLIDNYDSFTYNLVQAFLVLGAEVDVYRNDAITVDAALAGAHSHLVISPGPGTPRDAGVSMDMIRALAHPHLRSVPRPSVAGGSIRR
jgi:anthranilate/para-aminobenzoate synthase component II